MTSKEKAWFKNVVIKLFGDEEEFEIKDSETGESVFKINGVSLTKEEYEFIQPMLQSESECIRKYKIGGFEMEMKSKMSPIYTEINNTIIISWGDEVVRHFALGSLFELYRMLCCMDWNIVSYKTLLSK